MIVAYHHAGYAAPLGDHIMPIAKFALVAEEIKAFDGVRIESNQPVSEKEIGLVHTSDYIAAVSSGQPRELAESQKFPWTSALFPSVCLTSGGVLAAGREALKSGVAATLASGFHHACADHGEGFCTFNGLVIALEVLRRDGLVSKPVILDMDLHYGNGTASLAASRDWMRAASIYGNDYFENICYSDVTIQRHKDGPNHRSWPLPAGSSRREMLDATSAALHWLKETDKPDLMIFQAAADPYREDPYSTLDLGMEDLMERDRVVFEFARDHAIPIAWVLAGGYTKETSKVVNVHVNTFRMALKVYR
jgi:acetoin utilization deacetylase AcuC-like enzyme